MGWSPKNSTALLALLACAALPVPALAAGGDEGGEGGSDQAAPPADIVVTARLREERAIDVPVAVTVLTAGEIGKYNSDKIQRITEMVPGLVVGSTVGLGGGSIAIRGVSTAPTTVGFEQPVTVVVDGVPINTAWIASAGFFDLGRAEVLKGPQTLLFGKNNTAGVISLTSAEPTRSFEGNVRASHEFVGDELTVEGVLSGPLTETLSGRLALRYRHMTGWMHNTARAIANPFNPAHPFVDPPASHRRLGDEEVIGRATLKWEPAPNFTSTLRLTIDRTHNDGPGVTSQIVGGCTGPNPKVYNIADPNGECVPDNRVSQGQLPPTLAGFYTGAGTGEDRGVFNALIASFANQLDLGKVKLVATTGYTKWLTDTYGNFDETSYAQLVSRTRISYRVFSQELRAQTAFDGPINFMVGGFFQSFDVDPYYQYVKLRDDTDLKLATGSLVAFEKTGYQHNKTYSGFGQVTFKPAEQLEIAGGLRYTKETKRSFLGNTLAPGRASFPPGKSFTHRYSDDNVSPEVTVAFHPVRDVTIFAGYRTGYKSGGFALSSTITTASVLGDFDFDSEKVKGVEAGIKFAALGGSVRGDLTGYSYKFTKLQVNTYNPTTISYTLANAGALKQHGIDASLYWDVSREFQLRGSVNWNHNRYGTFIGQCWSGQTSAEGCNAAAQVYTGRAPARSPDWAGNIGATYVADLGSAKLTITGDAIYTGSYYGAETLSLGSYQPDFWRFNASARLALDNGVTLGVVGRNLGNKYYILSAQDKTGQTREQRGAVGRGREVAVEASYSF